jgi:hypothetical protein
MNSQELRELLQELLQAIEQVNASGEVLSDEFQGALAETLGNLYNRIEELDINETNQPPEQPPSIPTGALPSAPSNDAQLLWILAGQQPQAFISYLRTFPTQDTQQLVRNPDQLNATIVQLSQMMPPGEPPVINGIQHADLNSSNVWGAAFNQKTGKMRVRFQGGSIYEYDGIPRAIFDAFIHGNAEAKTNGQNQYGRWWKGKNPSLGAALNQYIKAGNFSYRRIR